MNRLPAYSRAIVLRGFAFALVWWVLAEGRADSWILGAPAVFLALLASLYLSPPGERRLDIVGVFGFIGFFLLQSLKAGVQVAGMALRPRLDLAPALLEFELRLPDGAARVWLVNTLNLLPGTLSVRIERDRLRLHVLDSRGPIEDEVRAAEMRIARMLGEVL